MQDEGGGVATLIVERMNSKNVGVAKIESKQRERESVCNKFDAAVAV